MECNSTDCKTIKRANAAVNAVNVYHVTCVWVSPMFQWWQEAKVMPLAQFHALTTETA